MLSTHRIAPRASPGQFDAGDPHASAFHYIKSEACTNHMAGWSPSSGLQSLASNRPFYLACDLCAPRRSQPPGRS